MSSSEEEKNINSPNRIKNEDSNEKSFKNSYSESNIEEKQYNESNNDNNNKIYLNLFCCKLSVGIIFTYIFIICSITINIVNRVIFLKYKFKFNMTFIFLQQFFCMIFFTIVSKYSKLFHNQTGEVSFNDFYKLKYQYIAYSIFFIIKTITSFLGYQLVTNIPMYVNLRKFLTAMTFIYQCCFKKKRISNINILVVILLTIGS